MSLMQANRRARRLDLTKALGRARARLRRAENEVQDLESELEHMRVEDDLEAIRSWRGRPDWHFLLDNDRTTPVYMLRQHFLERMSLDSGMSWADTNAPAVGLRMGAGTPENPAEQQIEHVERSLEIIVPWLIPRGGAVWINVYATDLTDRALSLVMAPDRTDVRLETMVLGRIIEEDRVVFSSLREALVHVQLEFPMHDHDPIADWRRPEDAPGGTGDALRAALEAFVEGCRIAGAPLPDGMAGEHIRSTETP